MLGKQNALFKPRRYIFKTIFPCQSLDGMNKRKQNRLRYYYAVPAQNCHLLNFLTIKQTLFQAPEAKNDG